MNNYRLLIQYDGSRYKGWQRLGGDENTIQGKIEAVLSELVGKKVEINGSSRTDAGVHALAQIANFSTSVNLNEYEIRNYLNRYLPQDISVPEVVPASEDFHARYNVRSKSYLYKIWNQKHPNPFMRKYSMHVEKRLNIDSMKKASQHFIGEHDFTTFTNAKSKKKSMVREIFSMEIEENAGFIEIRVQGNGFLHNMVRRMVGTLIEVGLGQVNPDDIPKMIDSRERNQVSCIADACGLYLEKVEY